MPIAPTPYDQAPILSGIIGTELLYAYQPLGTIPSTYRGGTITPLQLKSFVQGTSSGTIASMRQLKAALVSQTVMLTVLVAVPADPTNATNIAWFSAYEMTPTDTFVTGFLQPTLGYSNAQITALFTLALSFPV